MWNYNLGEDVAHFRFGLERYTEVVELVTVGLYILNSWSNKKAVSFPMNLRIEGAQIHHVNSQTY
jgi:hypothetical protein